MGTTADGWGADGWGDDGEYSVIGDKGEIGYIDYEDDKSVCSYNPTDEGLVAISVPFPFVAGKPQSVTVGERAVDSISIKNNSNESVDLWTKIYASNPSDSFTLSLRKPPTGKSDPNESKGFIESFSMEDRMVHPGETLTIWLSCRPKEIGLHTTAVQLDVQDDRIERVVFLLAEDKITKSLAVKKPYSRAVRKKQFEVDQFVSAPRPTRGRRTQSFPKNRLPRYDIPRDVRERIKNKETSVAIEEGLTRENYAPFFKTLLIMEELQLEVTL